MSWTQKGKVVREVKVASEPEALVRYFDELELPVCRIGLEAGPLSHWLHAGLVAAGRDLVFMRDNWLSNRVLSSYAEIIAHCRDAPNKLVEQPWKIMSIGLQEDARGF